MSKPDWRNLALKEGVLREPTLGNDHLVFWLPGSREGGFQNWERVSCTANAQIAIKQGICAVAATTIHARQPIRGFFGKLLARFQRTTGDGSWVLPNGESAEQCGERQTDRLLVWPQEQSDSLDENRIKSLWPQMKGLQKIARNLFLVSGVESSLDPKEIQQKLPPACPRAVAEQMLREARGIGNRRREASALADLGAAHLHERDAKRAVPVLEQALAITRELGDRSLETEVLGSLGLANLALGQRQRAFGIIEQELAYARASSNQFAIKLALEHLGHVFAGLGDPARALSAYEQALAVARELGDHKQEADLLWSLSIQHADLGFKEEAIARAQAAVDLMGRIGRPQTGWFADNLKKYRLADSGAGPGANADAALSPGSGELLGRSFAVTQYVSWSPPQEAKGQNTQSPGFLRMALTATEAMAKFVGSGLKTVSMHTHEQRQKTCASCEHHTGVRCRLCGCFTSLKVRLPHERCPVGKWPA